MLEISNPYTEEIIEKIPYNTTKDIDNTLKDLENSYLNTDFWLTKHKKISILKQLKNLVETHFDEIIEIAINEGGKPYKDTKVEVERAILGIELAIEEIGNLSGTEIPMGRTESSSNKLAFTFHEPIGVVAGISAFNHPLNLIVHQTVTAFAAGCPFVIKPDERTPLTCLFFMNLFYEAGLPKNLGKVIILTNSDAEKLATDKRVNYLSFIGSAKVGWYLRSKIAPGTRIALEHGGVAPIIVFEDANLDELIPALIKGSFYHAGQVCVSTQKIYIPEKLKNKICDKLIESTKKLTVGNPKDKKTDVGPIINKKEIDRIENWIKTAVKEGAEILCGGKRINNNCFEPTLLFNPSEKSIISNEEVFGPVVCIYTYTDYNHVINIINQSPFQFQASVFTHHLDLIIDASKKIKAPTLMINNHTAFRVDWMPFGGNNQSGIGIGGIGYSIKEMSKEKQIIIHNQYL